MSEIKLLAGLVPFGASVLGLLIAAVSLSSCGHLSVMLMSVSKFTLLRRTLLTPV